MRFAELKIVKFSQTNRFSIKIYIYIHIYLSFPFLGIWVISFFVTPELSKLFLPALVLFNYSTRERLLHRDEIHEIVHENALGSGGERKKKQKRRGDREMIYSCYGGGSKRRVRETRNKNKEDRNVSKFVVSSAMGLNGIYANDGIFKWTVWNRYLSHSIMFHILRTNSRIRNNRPICFD